MMFKPNAFLFSGRPQEVTGMLKEIKKPIETGYKPFRNRASSIIHRGDTQLRLLQFTADQ